MSKRLLQWFYKFSWKKIAGISLFILTLAILPMAREAVLNPTRTRSEASLIHPTPQPITQEFETPKGLPKIFLVDHFFGKVGDAVLIHGENLGGLHQNSSVSLAGKKIEVNDLVSWTGSYIEFKVPQGANSGQMEINILGNKTTWPGMFFVTDENTQTELRLEKITNNEAKLTARYLQNGQELLLWLLVIGGEDKLTIAPEKGVGLAEQRNFKYPIGQIYEVKLKLDGNIRTLSNQELTGLLTVAKTGEFLVGIARGELSTAQATLIPLQLHPLYVSF